MEKLNNRLMKGESAKGGGSQRSDGRWEAWYAEDRDPDTGERMQHSVFGATQDETDQKMLKMMGSMGENDFEGVTFVATFESLPLLLTVEEMASVLRIGRNPAYQLVKDGEVQSIRIGRSIRIPRNALIQFVENT